MFRGIAFKFVVSERLSWRWCFYINLPVRGLPRSSCLTEFIYTHAIVCCGYCCGRVGNTALLLPSSRQSILRSEILAKMLSLGLDRWHSLYRLHSITIIGLAMGWYRIALEQPENHCSFLRIWSITVDLFSLGMEGR